MTSSTGFPITLRAQSVGFLGDVVSGLAVLSLVPVAVLVVGTPVALAVRGLIELLEWL